MVLKLSNLVKPGQIVVSFYTACGATGTKTKDKSGFVISEQSMFVSVENSFTVRHHLCLTVDICHSLSACSTIKHLEAAYHCVSLCTYHCAQYETVEWSLQGNSILPFLFNKASVNCLLTFKTRPDLRPVQI